MMNAETPLTPIFDVEGVFLQQAESLICNGECLPAGVQGLAKRLQQAAMTGKPLTVKLGLDPTRPDLHLGHSVVLRRLRGFQDLGHQAVLIIGDATALIGDPSGRSQTRPPLTVEEVERNAQTYLDQAGHIIDLHKVQIVRNSDWFNRLSMGDWLSLFSKVTVSQMLVRDDFSKRLSNQKPIFLHEIWYPLMQAYDSVMVKADIELGGTDQRFNNLLGRELQQLMLPGHIPQMVLLMPLLEGTDGHIKMSKSYPEHCINLTDSPADMYGKVMSISDELMYRYEALLTPLTTEQIDEQRQLTARSEAEGGINPRNIKANLARYLVTVYHSSEAAQSAEDAFQARFRNRELPEDIPVHTVAGGQPHRLVDLMVDCQLAPSRSEARRLILGGGVRLNGQQKISDVEHLLQLPIGTDAVLQVGKRRFLRIRFR